MKGYYFVRENLQGQTTGRDIAIQPDPLDDSIRFLQTLSGIPSGPTKGSFTFDTPSGRVAVVAQMNTTDTMRNMYRREIKVVVDNPHGELPQKLQAYFSQRNFSQC